MAFYLTDRSLFYNFGAVLICLLCFFTAQKPDTVNIQTITGVSNKANADRLSAISGGLSDFARDSGLEVMIEKDSIRLRMYTDNMFRVSRAELSRDAQAALKSLSMRLRVYTPSHIHIEGYTTDEPTNTPQYPNNWYLSSARAIAVGMYLINEAGMDAKRVTAQGRGSSIPLDVSHQTKNGRIEIIVTP